MAEEETRPFEAALVMRRIARALSRTGRKAAIIALGVTMLETAILQAVQRAVGHDPTAALMGGAIGVVIGTIGTSFKTAAITHAIRARTKSYVPTLGESFRWAFARLPTVILTSAMTFVLMMIGFVIIVAATSSRPRSWRFSPGSPSETRCSTCVPTTPLAVVLSAFGIAATSGFTAVYAAVVYGLLTREPRAGLGERVARVFE